MSRSVQVVRLLAALTIAIAACWFTVLYDQGSLARYGSEHPRGEVIFSPLGEWITTHRGHAFAIPFVGLLLGLAIIWKWPTFHVLFESVVAALWVLAIVWAGLIVVTWQYQNIPTISPLY